MGKWSADKWYRKDLELLLSRFYWQGLLLGLSVHWAWQQPVGVKPLPRAEGEHARSHWNKLDINKSVWWHGLHLSVLSQSHCKTVLYIQKATVIAKCSGWLKKKAKTYTSLKNGKEEDPGNRRLFWLNLVPENIIGQMYRQKWLSKGRVTVLYTTWNELQDCIQDLISSLLSSVSLRV